MGYRALSNLFQRRNGHDVGLAHEERHHLPVIGANGELVH